MATQTLEFSAGTGLTLSCKLFALGSDTVVDTQTATEKTNDLNRYSVAFTDIPAGAYRLNAFAGSVGGFANEVYDLTLETATFSPRSESVGLDADGIRAAMGLASANLDTQLSATNTNVDSAESSILSAIGSITVDNAAIASAVRSELTTELGRIDVDVSSRLAASAYVGGRVVVPASALPYQVVRRYDNKLILRRFAAFQWTLSDVGDLSGVTKLVFTIKEKPDSELDSSSVLQIVATIPANVGSDGITFVNKSSGTSVRTQGSIVVQTYTEDFVTKKRIVVTATDKATALIDNWDNCRYDIKQIISGDSDILEEGDLVIQDISTRLISS